MLALLKAANQSPPWLRAAVTCAAIGSAYLFQIPVEVVVPGEPFLLFFVIVVACTLGFGQPVGFFAAVLSSVLCLPFFEPGNSLYITNAVDLIKVELYLILAGGSVPIVGALGQALLAAGAESQILAEREHAKSLLLAELSHRVANNFAVISAVMRQKAIAISDNDAKASLDEAIKQLTMMARIHGRLSIGPDDQAFVDCKSFLEGLCEDISSSADGGIKLCHLKFAAVSHPLHVSDAVPLGLILNELITNALKHAFPAGSAGQIEVTLDAIGEGLRLTVSDNGPGVSNKAHGSGLGHRLVRALARQLNGTVQVNSTALGTSIVVAFDPDRRSVADIGGSSRKLSLVKKAAF
jgi:two-component system, sensor histidine kinase PdtaS